MPREEWISFIPGAHPGYITLGQWEANIARLAANAAAHGRDRAAGPPREGPALLQGIIICGRCGGRMTIRYHARGGKDLPTYLCQRDGTGNARPICAAIPGHTLDERIGQLLIAALTPLAVEAALQVSAELQQRATEADALRAAHWSPRTFVDISIMLLLVPNCQVGARNPLGLSCRAGVVSGRDCNIARCSRTRRS